jgi:hypothetical protein
MRLPLVAYYVSTALLAYISWRFANNHNAVFLYAIAFAFVRLHAAYRENELKDPEELTITIPLIGLVLNLFGLIAEFNLFYVAFNAPSPGLWRFVPMASILPSVWLLYLDHKRNANTNDDDT